MREIPYIVKELKEIEAQGGLQHVDTPPSYPYEPYQKEGQKIHQNTMMLTDEIKKINKDSYSFQNLSVFLETCIDFLELYPASILIVDKKGTIKYANNRFTQWTGFNKTDLLETLFFSSPFYSSKNEQTIIKYALEQTNHHNNPPLEMIFQTKKGEAYTGLIHINSIQNPQDTVIGLIISITDITGLKIDNNEAKKLSQFQKSIIDNENIWLSVSDLNSNIMLWNKAAERISGYTKEEVMGANTVWEWLKPESSNKTGLTTKKGFTKIDNTIISEDFETMIQRKDGSFRIISWTPRMFFDQFENPVGTIAIGKDITDQKQYENKIKNQNKQLLELTKDLEGKVTERTKKIHDLLDQKNEFINQLGHDLKTPLTPLTVLLPIIKREVEHTDKKEIVEVLIRNTAYMKDLITKTIELAKLNSDMVSLTFEPLNLLNEVNYIIENNAILFQNRQISIENHVADNIYVEADKLRLQEILINLMTNAVKYSKENEGVIELNAENKSEFVSISIKDNGIGMTAEQIEKIFDEYYKADESRHNLDSSGLGLNITKRLVEKHGGTIRVESQGPGMGSTFIFTLKKYKDNRFEEKS